jgi:epimerase EvaD
LLYADRRDNSTVKSRKLAVEGAFEFRGTIHVDDRGQFAAPFQESAFVSATGHRFSVAQMNHSVSARNVLRGVHFTTTPPGQAKYVFCPWGRALDVVVDIRLGSPTFGAYEAIELSSDPVTAVYFPVGVGHAFYALEDDTVMSYMVTTGYVPEREQAVNPLDPALGLTWPADAEPILSERDRLAQSLEDLERAGLLPRYADCVAC